MIKLLPEHLIDQIKAGEVIERPANLLKELIENSIDAHATKIDLHLIDNGLEKISLQDNGDGILFNELPLAFCRHATSKLENFEDLYHLFTYGFRGEALASIAAISDVVCVSYHEASQTGGQINLRGGKQVSHQSLPYLSHMKGTSFVIKELFFNTPARLKFIQSKSSEKNSIKKIIDAFIISHPEIHFSLKWDDQDKDIYPSTTDLLRISKVLSSEVLKEEREFEELKLKAFVTEKPIGKKHYFFLNGRYLVDPKIHRIILQSLEKLWGPGQTGSYCIFLDLPREQVDVNVHPHKTQVKLAESGKVFSLLSSTLKLFSPKAPVVIVDKKPFRNIPPEREEKNSFAHYFDEPSDPQQSPLKVELNLFPHWSILGYQQNYLAFNYSRALQQHISDVFAHPQQIESVPLLISTPLQIAQLKHNTSELEKQYGIGLEHLDKNEWLLTSIPRSLEYLPYNEIILKFLTQEKPSYDDISLGESEIIWLASQSSSLQQYSYPFNSDQLEHLYGKK